MCPYCYCSPVDPDPEFFGTCGRCSCVRAAQAQALCGEENEKDERWQVGGWAEWAKEMHGKMQEDV